MRTLNFLGVILLLCTNFQNVLGQCDETMECTEDFCTSACAPSCEIPETEDCDGLLALTYDNSKDFCSCCPPRCIKYLEEGEACTTVSFAAYPSDMCGPQLGRDVLRYISLLLL